MPYKRFKKTVYKKVGGKWKKKHTYPSIVKARKAMKRLQEKEQRSKRKVVG